MHFALYLWSLFVTLEGLLLAQVKTGSGDKEHEEEHRRAAQQDEV